MVSTKKAIVGIVLMALILLILLSCLTKKQPVGDGQPPNPSEQDFPHVASYIAESKLNDLIENSDLRFDIVYTSNLETADLAQALRQRKSDTIMLYQSSLVYLPDAVKSVMQAVTGREVTDDMWLENQDGTRVAYGMGAFGVSEYYAFDIRKSEVRDMIATYFSTLLQVGSHFNGLFFDIVESTSRCDNVSDTEWAARTADLLSAVRNKIGSSKIILVNGANYSATTPFLPHINGYNLEAFLSGGVGVDAGLAAVSTVKSATSSPHILLYNVYHINAVTGENVGMENVRLALALSLLNDETYLAYDYGTANPGQGLWLNEFSSNLGTPLGAYSTRADGAYQREFTNGVVVAAPYSNITITFDNEYVDTTTGSRAKTFALNKGDGRVFVKAG